MRLLLVLAFCVSLVTVVRGGGRSHDRVERATMGSGNTMESMMTMLTELYNSGSTSAQELGEALLKFIYLLKGASVGHKGNPGTDMGTPPTPRGPETEMEPKVNQTDMLEEEMLMATPTVMLENITMATAAPEALIILEMATTSVIVTTSSTQMSSSSAMQISPSSAAELEALMVEPTYMMEMGNETASSELEDLTDNTNTTTNSTDGDQDGAEREPLIGPAPMSNGTDREPLALNNTTTPPSGGTMNSTTTVASITRVALGGTTVKPTTATANTTGGNTSGDGEEAVVGEGGEWGPWTQCSQSCGGCGTRVRKRDCSVTGCIKDEIRQKCGLEPCPSKPIQTEYKCYKSVPCPRVRYPSYPRGRGSPRGYPGNRYPGPGYTSRRGSQGYPGEGNTSPDFQTYSRFTSQQPTVYPNGGQYPYHPQLKYPGARRRRATYGRQAPHNPQQGASPNQVGTYNININTGLNGYNKPGSRYTAQPHVPSGRTYGPSHRRRSGSQRYTYRNAHAQGGNTYYRPDSRKEEVPLKTPGYYPSPPKNPKVSYPHPPRKDGTSYPAGVDPKPTKPRSDQIFKIASGHCIKIFMCETSYESGPFCCNGHSIHYGLCMSEQYYQWYKQYYGYTTPQ